MERIAAGPGGQGDGRSPILAQLAHVLSTNSLYRGVSVSWRSPQALYLNAQGFTVDSNANEGMKLLEFLLTRSHFAVSRSGSGLVVRATSTSHV